MTIQRMDHVSIVVNDLASATAFFVELGLELRGEGSIEAAGSTAQIAMLQTPDGHGRLELTEFHAPPAPVGDQHAPPNTPGLRHLAFAVDDIDAVLGRLRARGAELVGAVERFGDSYPRPGGHHRRAGGTDRLKAPTNRQTAPRRQSSSQGRIPNETGFRDARECCS